MRLIDADALIKDLNDYIVNPNQVISEHPDDIFKYNSGLLSAIQAVMDAPTILEVLEEPKTGKWIPCSEGYPEMDERVLVNLDGRDDIHAWDCMSNRGDSYFWEDEVGLFHGKYEVLYWMRIPELSGKAEGEKKCHA